MQILLAAALFLMAMAGPVSAQEETADITFDGLERIEDAGVGMAYIDPDADFSVFQRVAILDPYVAFRSNWLRDMNRGRGRRVSNRDMERIRDDMAALFRDVFTERLEAAGFQIVNAVDYDVLTLRPAIIDLDVAAPDIQRGSRSRTYVASAGAATLYLQLVDSVSGDVIGRAADRRVARQPGGQITWSNRVSNVAEARRHLGVWADTLVDFLTSHYYQPVPGDDESAEGAGTP